MNEGAMERTCDDPLERAGDAIRAMFERKDAEIARLRAAAERVCWFDWSSNNDTDAVATIDELRKIINSEFAP
jgi:hypothetical protein